MRSLALSGLRSLRTARTFSTAPATPPVKSAFELDDAPLFSLRTRIIFFSVLGSAALASAASFWLTSDQENAYWAFEMSPELMRAVGPRLGVPIDPETGAIDKNVLGPRDIRDLVGHDKIGVEIVFKNGSKMVTEGLPMEPLRQVLDQAQVSMEDDALQTVRVLN